MTPQLQAALDALNACPDASAVAALLRRHGVRALPDCAGDRCAICPIAMYLVIVGGAKGAEVFDDGGAVVDGESVGLSSACIKFIRCADEHVYPDLEAEA